jgi:hypothetical protein
MKKLIEIKWILILILNISTIGIFSCKKDSSNDFKNLHGTWISSDLVDTIEFRSEHDLYKTVGIPKDHFYYSITGDSMTIQYKGALFILVQPTNHNFRIEDGILTLNLKDCYGFRNQEITFSHLK